MTTVLLLAVLAAQPVYQNVKPVEMKNATGMVSISVEPAAELPLCPKGWRPPVPFEAFGCAVKRDEDGKIARSEKPKNDFKRRQACPSTGKHHGPCPGWVIDHIVPLCAGGCDVAANMQWQKKTREDLEDASGQKDLLEVTICWAGVRLQRCRLARSEPVRVTEVRP